VFAALAEDLHQLQVTGFAVAAVFDPKGGSIPLDSPAASMAPWFHIVAQKSCGADGTLQAAPAVPINI